MKNNQDSFEEFEEDTVNLKDYLRLIRINFWAFAIIIIISTIIAGIYAFRLKDIYVSSCSIKISKTEGNILSPQPFSSLAEFGDDRFINNEIEILKSYNLREIVAKTILDSVGLSENKEDFQNIYRIDKENQSKALLEEHQIINLLTQVVSVEQKKGLDVILISAESPSPREAMMIADIYTAVYKKFNLQVNRDQLSSVRNFLDRQRTEKKNQLLEVEDTLREFQEKGGLVILDQQAQALINNLSEFESRMNAAKIDLIATNEMLNQYKQELSKQDPKLAEYLESVTSETYIRALQNQISELQLNKDLALAKFEGNIDISKKVIEYDNKIRDLKTKLDEKVKILKSGIFASSPEEVRALSQKIIEAEVRSQSLKSSVNSLSTIVRQYEDRFNKLPKTTIELARFQRTRESTAKLFTLIEEKFQEALINEESQPGNVLIIDNARIPTAPAKPNRMIIILSGLLIGIALAIGFIVLKNYFDDTVKTPEDIEKKKAYVLAWIPKVEELNGKSTNGSDFIIEKLPSSIASESIRALRTRVQFSKMHKDNMRVILVTSPAPQEGKTTIALNLAGSFAHSNRRTLLIDADLRKPRLHQVFNRDKEPGLTNYLFGEVPFEKILVNTGTKNLFLISSGTIIGNPSEILESAEMEDLIRKARSEFDYVIVDSPPIVAVTDAEILARMVDGSILVVSAKKTDSDLLERGLHLIKNEDTYFIGAVLNNFSTKPGYGSYYKYYYYYSPEGEKKFKKRKKNLKHE
jgi:tyrosine-protein kinase Etk/Wzc